MSIMPFTARTLLKDMTIHVDQLEVLTTIPPILQYLQL